MVNQTWLERERIEPRCDKRPRANLMQLYRLLPRSNCAKCGYAACMAFAAALREGETKMGHCPVLEQPSFDANRSSLLRMMEPAES
ncbi:MAG: hypothetical protein A2V99_02105 [Spirochaetes bacterium RBG_16_67_19]|nr:MAG: hypothetical protein A2V99_02105 [Spirochaetes bacterium RBG_16_67_19]